MAFFFYFIAPSVIDIVNVLKQKSLRIFFTMLFNISMNFLSDSLEVFIVACSDFTINGNSISPNSLERRKTPEVIPLF
jgi:hypothetical protein